MSDEQITKMEKAALNLALDLVFDNEITEITHLLVMFNEGDAEQRQKVALRLGMIGDDSSVNQLIEWLGQDSLEVRNAAMHGIGNVKKVTSNIITALVNALEDKETQIRERAAINLRNAAGKGIRIDNIVPLLKYLEDDREIIRVNICGIIAIAAGNGIEIDLDKIEKIFQRLVEKKPEIKIEAVKSYRTIAIEKSKQRMGGVLSNGNPKPPKKGNRIHRINRTVMRC